jgi:hypothetical protein
MTYFWVGRDRAEAVRILKAENAKDQLVALVRASVLSDSEIEVTVTGIEDFWNDRSIRNRLIHDEWATSLANPIEVEVRGLTKKKVPEETYLQPTVSEVWDLARRFSRYTSLFTNRAWLIDRNCEAP